MRDKKKQAKKTPNLYAKRGRSITFNKQLDSNTISLSETRQMMTTSNATPRIPSKDLKALKVELNLKLND